MGCRTLEICGNPKLNFIYRSISTQEIASLIVPDLAVY